MELYLDTGNLNEIKELSDILRIDGVTTNPTLVSKERKNIIDLLDEIIEVIGEDKIVHAQVVSKDYQGMIEEAEFLSKRYKNIYVKIPVTVDGLKAIKELSNEGIKTTATAVFTAHQAALAAKAGACYIAPYVNRLDNISGEGVKVVKDIIKIINNYDFNTKVIAASFKNSQQVIDVIKEGVHSITVPADVMKSMMGHPLTDYSVDKFIFDWERAFGEGTKVTNYFK
ncbi:fructose-6-phosphate aldolase 2 [Caloranaerobacter azorensis DSM 13643]|uniref:Fructose-6-phosphate aldolase 2 n=1 Tax=Caloranaerobacter azorensis DSM 13643 TaxID=1121264 RepID=A0A1M5VGZ6_9FIRM|nr:fructose-6-phosphate aldolase [Caloranaerobacter azorensis]SHH74455.1 fructose-6-phosphate aldolase 2 [Caloranaerobacter azorensis DSM 13643]